MSRAQRSARLPLAAAPNGGEVNHIRLPSDALPTDAPSIVGSIATSRPRTWAHLIQTTQRSGFCAALGVGSGPRGVIAGLNWFSPQLSRISLRRIELGGYATQDCAESLGFTASIIGSRHAQQHGEVDGREVEINGSKAETKDGRSN